MQMVETNTGTFRDLLLHVRDHADKPFLFHCTAGKDRTGAAAGLLLALVGVPKGYISHDFSLTRIGTEKYRDLLTMKLTGGKPVDMDDPKVKWKLATFGSSKYVARPNIPGGDVCGR
jgi:protein tyrosine/serine phosphatase